MKVVVETESPGDLGTMFRLHIDSKQIGEGLTAVQAHILVGEILERIVQMKSAGEAQVPSPASLRRMSPDMLQRMSIIPPRA